MPISPAPSTTPAFRISSSARRASGIHTPCRTQRFTARQVMATSDGARAPSLDLANEVAALKDLVTEQGRMIMQMQQELAHARDEAPKDARRIWTYEQYAQLPERIILMRHAKSVGNEDGDTYCHMPDNAVPLSAKGRAEALAAGQTLRASMDLKFGGPEYKLFFMASPYSRTVETLELLIQSFTAAQVVGLRQEVQLREQDFGNFQDSEKIKADLNERLRYGRFWFRFPNGESGADVFDRMTIFHDHLLRDFSHGRFRNSSLTLVTHGITLRVFLMRWFHWTVSEFLQVMNPPNSQPIILEKYEWEVALKMMKGKAAHVKQLYFIAEDSLRLIPGCSVRMASHESRWTSPNSSYNNLNSSMLSHTMGGPPMELEPHTHSLTQLQQEPPPAAHAEPCRSSSGDIAAGAEKGSAASLGLVEGSPAKKAAARG